jgi:hypothetical protein
VSLLRSDAGPPPWEAAILEAGRQLTKAAGDATPAYNLAGTLYLDRSGWLLLSVPNALVRGVFAAMSEPGAEMPRDDQTGGLNAHVSVMTPAELELAGGADKVGERGKQFRYTLGRLVEAEPADWPGVAKVWFLRVHSPELQDLRRSYGLSSLPGGTRDFHVTCALRRRGVLGRNDTRKEGPQV